MSRRGPVRPARRASERDRPRRTVELDIERPGPGGDCIAHLDDGRVVFVRGALPGERVRAAVVEQTTRFARADVVEVLDPSAERVPPPCPLAVPGRCGGCDWQHAAPAYARTLKAEVVRDQLMRLGGLADPQVEVEAVPEVEGAAGEGLGWRTRVQVSVTGAGARGLLRHRSHQVQPVTHCPITHPFIERAGAWSGGGQRSGAGARQARIAYAASTTTGDVVVDGAGPLVHEALGRTFQVSAGGFWQVHPAAPDLLAQAVIDAVRPGPGESALDLYAGAGLFTHALLEQGLAVTAVEHSAAAAADARTNCPGAEVLTADVAEIAGQLPAADVVVLDPPRTGAGTAVMQALAALRPRVIAYVSCDAATLARDLRAAGEAGYRTERLRAFDLFPMTAHVELLAVLTPQGCA